MLGQPLRHIQHCLPVLLRDKLRKYALKHAESKFFDNLESVEWEGKIVNIPSHAKEYLQLNYGRWEIPDPDFDPSVDSGTIAEKGF